MFSCLLASTLSSSFFLSLLSFFLPPLRPFLFIKWSVNTAASGCVVPNCNRMYMLLRFVSMLDKKKKDNEAKKAAAAAAAAATESDGQVNTSSSAAQTGPSVETPGTCYSLVCCWFSTLLREVFLRVLRFSPLPKTQHFQIPIRSE